MKNRSVFDCFILMGTALSIKGGTQLPEMARPLLQKDVTAINISLVIEEISIYEDNMIMEIDGILSQKWIDPRLGANEQTRKIAVTGKIWEPKITNVNGKNIMEKDEHTIFWRGFGDEGNILLSKKIILRTHCTRNLQNFPFDIQYCDFKFGSYRFPDDEVSLLWDEPQIKILSKPRMTEFILLNVTENLTTEMRASGSFSIASVKFTMKRNFTRYVLCTGAPCIFVVVLEYISLWMELDRRWNVNLLSFCVTSYYYFTSLCSIAAVPYFKALDVFLGICTFFSFFSLLETFAVDSLSKLENKHEHLRSNTRSNTSFQTFTRQIYWLELGMKIAFPIFYLLFISFFGFIYVL